VAFHIVARGVESFFDTRILAELSPDQLLDAVVVQQAPVVPVSNVEVSSRPDPDGERSSITIRYDVPGSEERGEIRIEQLSPDSITVETFLEGRQIAFGVSSPDQTTVLRFPHALEGLTDTAILSADSVFADSTATEALVRGLTTSAALTCEDACFQKLLLADAATHMSTCGAGGVFARISCRFSTALARLARIAPELKKCQATCPAGNLIIGVTVSEVAGTQPSQSRVIASGQLCNAEGAVGATSFTNAVGPTQTVNPGRNRPVGGLEVRNLRRGIWAVVALAQGLTGPACKRVRVDGFVTIIPGVDPLTCPGSCP
jgi:hypothetical protein